MASRGPGPVSFLGLVWEKVPLFALIAIGAWAAFVTQQQEGVVASLDLISLSVRLQNVLVGYYEYIQKTFWPDPLAVLYPHPGRQPLWRAIPAAVFLAGVTLAGLCWICCRPWFAVGWFWYLGTLVPVIGLVVIGPHAVADRYTYIPPDRRFHHHRLGRMGAFRSFPFLALCRRGCRADGPCGAGTADLCANRALAG